MPVQGESVAGFILITMIEGPVCGRRPVEWIGSAHRLDHLAKVGQGGTVHTFR